MDDFNPFQKDSLDQIFNLTDIENKINQIQSTYDSSTIDTDEQVYITMMEELLEINLPNSLEITKNADSLLFYPREENIDVEIVSAISEEEYQASKREDYVTSILFWNQENLETKIGFKEITAAYDDYEEVILRTFEFDISKDYAEPTSPYLIIESLGDLRFKENYFEQEQGGYFSIQLHDTNTMIEFSTTDDVDFVNIPAFISPVLSDLSLIDGSPQGGEIEWKWAIVGLIIVLIILLGLAASTFLKKWYKTKDETRLFKNKRDLHNIISYINRMKKKGMSKGDLIYNLRKAHWTNEQIRYAMKRYSKKNKGVFEIPVEKILEKVKEKSGKNAPRRY